MIDCIRIINLDRTPERMARFRALHPGLPIQRVVAVDGLDTSRDACIAAGVLRDTNTYRAGAIGCALSHIGLWRACAAEQTPFHIAEDDVILRNDFLLMADVMLETLGAWDIVLWSHNLDWPLQACPGDGVGTAVIRHGGAAIDPWSFRSGSTQPLMMKLLTAAGTGCYSLSPDGARRLLDLCLPIGDEPAIYDCRDKTLWSNTGIDVEMSRHYVSLNAFVAVPVLALAENDKAISTIQA